MDSIKKFYKSKAWESLIKVLRLERVDNDGILRCEYCGKPILKPYDCIGHHKIELTPGNVNDSSISLNAENIMLIHFKCHNEIHGRFGNNAAKKVYLVYGAPCAGKTTFVTNNAGRDDIVLDMDSIWQMISINPRYDKPNRLKQNVFGIRDCILDQIKMRVGKWQNAWVIGGYPLKADRERIANMLGAELVHIAEKKDVCLARAAERKGWDKFVEKYFADFQP